MIVLAIIALLPVSVSAHASLIETEPADGAVLDAVPSQVTLAFSEPVDLVDDGYRLFDSEGLVSTLSAGLSGPDVLITLPADLPDGSYVVGWRVISMDSHPISGAVMFSVGEPGTAPVAAPESSDVAPLMGAVQAVGYLALLAGVGILLFRAIVVRDVDRPTTMLAIFAADLAIIAHLLLIPLTTIRAEGESAGAIVDSDMWRVGFTHPTVLAVALLALGFIVAIVAARAQRATTFGVLLGGIVALGSLPLVGHTESVEPRWLMYTSDLVHGLVGAIWFGGLIGLVRYLLREGRADPVTGATVVSRFSVIAGLAFAAAATSGAIMAFQIIDGPDALFQTTYGRLLIAKIAVLLIPFGLATWNRLQLVPAVERAPDTASAWGRLRMSVAAEAVLLVVVIGLTGFLVFQSPNVSGVAADDTSVAAVPYEETVELDGGTLAIRLTPGSTGQNEIEIELQDVDGQPIVLLDNPVVELSLPAEELGPLTTTVPESGTPGQYAGPIQIPLEGEWELSVITRISRFDQPTTTVTVQIPHSAE